MAEYGRFSAAARRGVVNQLSPLGFRPSGVFFTLCSFFLHVPIMFAYNTNMCSYFDLLVLKIIEIISKYHPHLYELAAREKFYNVIIRLVDLFKILQ